MVRGEKMKCEYCGEEHSELIQNEEGDFICEDCDFIERLEE